MVVYDSWQMAIPKSLSLTYGRQEVFVKDQLVQETFFLFAFKEKLKERGSIAL